MLSCHFCLLGYLLLCLKRRGLYKKFFAFLKTLCCLISHNKSERLRNSSQSSPKHYLFLSFKLFGACLCIKYLTLSSYFAFANCLADKNKSCNFTGSGHDGFAPKMRGNLLPLPCKNLKRLLFVSRKKKTVFK